MLTRTLISLALPAVAVSASVVPRSDDVSAPGLVSFPIENRQRTVALARRDTDTDVPLYNISTISYLVALSIGSPGQTVKVAVDTGSDELWVSPLCSNVRQAAQRQECVADGTYVPGSSSSAVKTGDTGSIKYGKGQVKLQYFRDSITMPDSTISLTNVTFGVATQSQDLNEGILGLSYGFGANLGYNNYLDSLYLQNVTASRAFSLALGPASASNAGVLVFGGLDVSKYSGKLSGVPILPPQNGEKVRRYWVQMDGVGSTLQPGVAQNTSKRYAGSGMPVVLDSGSTLSYLPNATVQAMAADAGGKWSADAGAFLVDCGLSSSSSTFDFSFGGGKYNVSIPWRDFIWPVTSGTCVLGAVPLLKTLGVTPLLGDTFLRSVYAVFDQTSNSIYMAPYANCGTTEKILPRGTDAALQFEGQCKAGQGVNGTSGGSGGSDDKKNAATGRFSGSELWTSAVALLVVVFVQFVLL